MSTKSQSIRTGVTRIGGSARCETLASFGDRSKKSSNRRTALITAATYKSPIDSQMIFRVQVTYQLVTSCRNQHRYLFTELRNSKFPSSDNLQVVEFLWVKLSNRTKTGAIGKIGIHAFDHLLNVHNSWFLPLFGIFLSSAPALKGGVFMP